MTNKNDALPSWSGFNYQGKMALLCVILTLNKNKENKINSADFSFELEKHEDFVIFQGGYPRDVYQVKARLNYKTFGCYTGACNKLIEHKEEVRIIYRAPDDIHTKCHIITAVPITNWTDQNNTFIRRIRLFRYRPIGKNPVFVSVNEVPIYIKEQIKKFMTLFGYNCTDDEIVHIYLDVCDYIDLRIAEFHRKGKDTSYLIAFEEISTQIFKSHKKSINNKAAHVKEMIYEHICNKLNEAFKHYCNGNCVQEEIDCNVPCGVTKHYEDLYTIELYKYIKVLNPHVTDWQSDLHFSDNIQTEDYKNLVLDIYSLCNESQVSFCDNVSFIHNDGFFTGELCGLGEIIPTLVRVNGTESRKEQSLQDILKSIGDNTSIFPLIDNRILSADTGGVKLKMGEENVTYIPDGLLSAAANSMNLSTDMNMHVVIVDINDLYNKISSLRRSGHA